MRINYHVASWANHRQKDGVFEASLRDNGSRIYLGRFKKADDAARAYDEKAKEVHGEFSCLNFPEK